MVVRGSSRSDRTYPTEAEARQVAADARAEISQKQETVGVMVEAFLESARKRELKARTVEAYRKRLELVLEPAWDLPVGQLTAIRARNLYERLVGQVAVDTHRQALIYCKSWGAFCVDEGAIRKNPFAAVKGVGRRKRGIESKDQLTADESVKLLNYCLARADDWRALVTATLLLLGCRVSELMERRIRDLDSGGRLLWIPSSKTEAGRRVLEVPEILREHLQAQVKDRPPTERIFPQRRESANRAVHQMCERAGVPSVGPHSLRGTHSTLARAAGATAEIVAAALGHASTGMQDAHYVADGVQAIVAQRAAWRVLDGKGK